jgi:PAS domain S-box-containing protein
LKKSTERAILLAGAILLAFFAGNIALNATNLDRLKTQADWVAHTYAVNDALEGILSQVKDAETGQRGYLVTGNPRYLAPYDNGVAALNRSLAEVERLTADNPTQQASLQALRVPLQRKLDELQATIRIRKEQGFEAARAVVENDTGLQEMEQVRGIADVMIARENALLAIRRGQAEHAYRQALAFNLAGGLAACALLAAFLMLMRRHLASRERASRQLAEQGELIQTTLASIGDGVITSDTLGCVTFLNPVAMALTGWTHKEAQGVPLARVFNIVNEEHRGVVENPAARALRDGLIVGLANHTLLISRDGTERPIDDSAAPIRLDSGEIVGCVLVFRDVSERARMDRELKDADRRKDEFLATLAHELRNPLAPIANSLFILSHEGTSGAAAQAARATMQRQVRQLVRLIDDLLDVSRIRLGKISLRMQRVELAHAIEQAVETARPAIDAAGHRLRLELPSHPAWLEADPVRLAQVFSNLLSNAAKFTPQGGSIEMVAVIAAGGVTVTVRDSGIGIEPRNLDSIFGLFAQVDQSLERSQGGLGIGLNLVRRLVELHGGSVAAQSEGTGRGSEFIVKLPLAMDQGAPEVAVEDTMGTRVGQVPRVLVVDDNRDGADSLCMMIETLGGRPRAAYDGSAALEIASELRPDVVFLDIGLPGMSGYEVCRRMRATDWGRRAMIVALTGWGQDQDRRHAEGAGFDRHVVKPIEDATLRLILLPPTR